MKRRIYYRIKPLIPRHLQILIRRKIACYKRRKNVNVWPIDPSAAKAPQGWKGWPEKKRFALVFHHDVDSIKGLKKCAKLMNLEKELGFRSSFNFVAEDYPLPPSLRQSLDDSGFEIGVHGLKHDGKLFENPIEFCKKVPKINFYLKKWGSVGFTSPSMLRNLLWTSELSIEHACSTFDTDPFEPQSDGVGTIFPFVVNNALNGRAYVEIPYTLPQDHGLFIILQEKDMGIWKQKIDWIAQNGGMAVLNTHPDYMRFDEGPLDHEEYPISRYIEFLDYVKKQYHDQYWHVLPRDLARFWRESMPCPGPGNVLPKKAKHLPRERLHKELESPQAASAKIWIDLDNTPHVPFFTPIIKELERRGHKVVLTARDAFQVIELAEDKGLHYCRIGHHYGRNPIMKVLGLLWRTIQLIPFVIRQKPGLALSHGARSQILACTLLRIPTILLADYEYSHITPVLRPSWTIVPDFLSPEGLPSKVDRVRYYRGLKEDVYTPEFEPSTTLSAILGIRDEAMIVTVRPPASEAHYHNPESDVLLIELMSRICQTPNIQAILLPRNHAQEENFRKDHPFWFEAEKTIVPPRAVNGLDLIWLSDFVVSGGGTMNREAAALGVPVYSIFRGKTGAVDLSLEKQGRLTMIHSVEEIWSKIQFIRRNKARHSDIKLRVALQDIIENIEHIIRFEGIRPLDH